MDGSIAPSAPWVTIVAYDGLCAFEFGIAVEVFAIPRPELTVGWYRCRVAGCDPAIRGLGGVRVEPDGGLDLLAGSHLIVIPGWRDAEADPPPALLAALRAAHAGGSHILSICSGAFVLGAAGLLAGRRATTHWHYAERLRSRFPDARIDAGALYTEDDGIVTGAGSSAGIDACLHVVQRDFGAPVANIVARRLVMPPHRDGGQTQFTEAPVRLRPGRSIAWVLEWALAHLNEPIDVHRLATMAVQSERTFLRRFKQATGTTPGRWLRRMRVRRAEALLENTDMALADIAENCGFQSLDAFRLAFKEIVGTPPGDHRQRRESGGRPMAPLARV